jgi:cytochrome c biogenesis protein CcdA
MLKAIVLLFFSMSLWAVDDHATISLQRFQDKMVVTVHHDKGWHTYWKNPGDSGIASSFKFSSKKKPLEVKADEWPVPTKHIEAGDIITIGYEDKQHFFFDNIAQDLEVHVGVLICKDICIPGEADLALSKTAQFVSNRPGQAYSESELEKAFKTLPHDMPLPDGFEYYLTRKKGENVLTLHYSMKAVKVSHLPHQLDLLTGFPQPPFGFKRESLFLKDGTLYGKTEIEWDGEYQEPALPLPENGNFKTPYDLRFLLNAPGPHGVNVIHLKISDFSVATPALDDFYKKLPSFSEKKTSLNEIDVPKGNIFEYLGLAFLGGLILNLMPCVLPVISIKLFGLIKHKNYTRKKILAHNLSYTAGVLSTLMALAMVIVGLKMTGEEIGWGFQLQSPTFILAMMLVLFVLSLNLFGLFEFATPGGSKLGGLSQDESLRGDFFSGILTTILSTPCSAPFLGTALTFAFSTSYAMIFIMFFAIGLGLAFPFLMTAVFPQSLQIFPKPGMWMEKLKYFLGLSLLATIIWLYDIFVSLVEYEVISWRLNLIFALWFFAFFFAQKISKNRVLQFIAFAIPLTLTVLAAQHFKVRSTETHLSRADSTWIPWTEEKLKEQKGKTVLIDFTAEWCLTCKINKKLVLETDGFKELREKQSLVTMRADWTKRDDNITRFLRSYGAVGVPAYFIQTPDGKIKFLGETLSLSKIEENIR